MIKEDAKVAVTTIDAPMLAKMFLAGAKNLEAKKEWINELNVFPVPDGDTGTNMTMTIMSAAAEVSSLGADLTMASLAKAVSSGSLRGARGNSGVILSQLFRGFTKGIGKYDTLDVVILSDALQKAVETAYKAVMKPKEGTILTVAKGAADKALELRLYGNIGVAYTYNEPLVGYEYVRDCASLVHERGMVNVLVTNGTIEEAPWRALLPLIDAANIDLKGFTPEWYRKLGGDLETVKRSISLAAGQCHVEVTTLLIPGENDSEEEIRNLAQWLASVDRNIPLHLSRFFPRYRMMDKTPALVERVYRLADVAREYLPFVYTGNC